MALVVNKFDESLINKQLQEHYLFNFLHKIRIMTLVTVL